MEQLIIISRKIKVIFALLIVMPLQLIQTVSICLAASFAMIDKYVKKIGLMLARAIFSIFEKEETRRELKCEFNSEENSSNKFASELFKVIYH